MRYLLTALFLYCLILDAFAGINTWTQCSGTYGYAIGALLIDTTTTTGRIYVGTNGFLISNDYGTTWVYSSITAVSLYDTPLAIAVNPKSPNEVYLYMADGDGIAKSTTYGYGNWTSITNDLSDACAIPNLLIDPENVGRMYAGACLSGSIFVYRSDDTGYHWTSSMSGITTDQGLDMLIMNPTNHNILYAGASGSPGIFISVDGATTWNSMPLYMSVESLAIDPTNDQYIYAGSDVGGFASSFDGGYAWNICTDPTITGNEVETVVVNPLNPKIIYVGTYDNGVFKSKDQGNTWSAMSTGLSFRRIISLAYDTISQTLFAGNPGDIGMPTPQGVWMYQDTDLTTPPPPVSVPKEIWQMFE